MFKFPTKKAKNKDGVQSIPGSRYPHSDVDCPLLRICHVFVPVPLDLAPISLLCRNEPSFLDFLPFEMSLTLSIPCWTMLMLNVFFFRIMLTFLFKEYGDFCSPEFHWAVYDDLCTNCVKKLLRIEENQSWIKSDWIIIYELWTEC